MDLSPLIFALDLPTVAEARAFALRMRDSVGMIKVGLEIFVEAGPAAVALGRDVGLPVFLDLKLHDIPETVERAVARASSLGASLLTVHAGGGRKMLRRAVERASASGSGLEIVAVTVLTSLDDADLATMGVADGSARQVVRLAKMAFEEGVRAFVCSPHEARAVRAALGDGVTIITPGVRIAAAAGADDQKRVMTAGQAIAEGASRVVVGRPIRDADDPVAAAATIAREIETAFRARSGAPS